MAQYREREISINPLKQRNRSNTRSHGNRILPSHFLGVLLPSRTAYLPSCGCDLILVCFCPEYSRRFYHPRWIASLPKSFRTTYQASLNLQAILQTHFADIQKFLHATEPTIDRQAYTGNPRRILTSQEHRRLGNILRRTQTTKRMSLLYSLLLLCCFGCEEP